MRRNVRDYFGEYIHLHIEMLGATTKTTTANHNPKALVLPP